MFAWQEILHFWFGDLDQDGLPDKFHRERWFKPSRAFDWEIRRRFLSMVLVASEDGLENWREEPGGALTEILLLDQDVFKLQHRFSLRDQKARTGPD